MEYEIRFTENKIKIINITRLHKDSPNILVTDTYPGRDSCWTRPHTLKVGTETSDRTDPGARDSRRKEKVSRKVNGVLQIAKWPKSKIKVMNWNLSVNRRKF